jgi:uncharacterized protein YjbJ (UPF0337 family)
LTLLNLPARRIANQRSGACTGAAVGNVAGALATKEETMDWNIIEGNWKQFKGTVKEKWGRLTDDHLELIAGRREQLAGHVQEAYGITKDQAEVQVKAFEALHENDYELTVTR